ncbi:MAG: hypothetical protein KatS3mg114_1150 [Planctomycetaceae bacterium]|nr:MAG: hypothetical protein KatS3mg114_1150 [Planctomycetaceae bacterium]
MSLRPSTRRRLTLQLIPLLDLLLIVVFAQYLEGRLRQEEQRDTFAQQQRAAEEQRRRLEARLADVETSAETLQQHLDRYTQVFLEIMQAAETALQQSHNDGKVAELPAGIPPQILLEQLSQLRHSPERVWEHLVRYAEIRKRIDLWQLHLTEQGECVLCTGLQRIVFRADTAPAFAQRLFETYKQLPEPKSVVLILVTWGDVRFVWRKAATEGLATAVDLMRQDSGQRIRFDYALLGYRLQSEGCAAPETLDF